MSIPAKRNSEPAGDVPDIFETTGLPDEPTHRQSFRIANRLRPASSRRSLKDIRFPAYPTMFHPNTDKENNGLQDIQKQKRIIIEGRGEERGDENSANWVRAFQS